MRTSSLKLIIALFSALFIAGCATTESEGGGGSSSDSGVSASGVNQGGVESVREQRRASQATIESNGNTIYFDYDSDVIRPDGRQVLMEHAARLQKAKSATLEGHADERGSREYNIALGERRAKAVRDFLVVQGVSSAKLEVVSYGEERLADKGTSEMAHAKNRRVEIK